MKTPNRTADIIKPFGEYRTPGPNKNVIALLKKTLEEAERGEIVAIAMAAISDGGFVCIRVDKGSRGMSEMIGAVSVMKHDLLEDWTFRTDDAI